MTAGRDLRSTGRPDDAASTPRLARTAAHGAARPVRWVTAAAAMAWIALSGCAAADSDEVARVERPAARPGESTAHALHRHGVRCMDELARPDCAAKYLQQLVDLDPPERQLVGDAIFRLVRLHRKEGDLDAIKRLLRHYWELGMARPSAGNVPWGLQFLPAEIDVVTLIEVSRLRESWLYEGLPRDVTDTMFTCDETRRKELEDQRRARRAEKRKAAGKPDAEGEDGKGAGERNKRRGKSERSESIADEGLCAMARALAADDLQQWRRFVLAQDHANGEISAVIAEIPELEAKLAAATAEGRLKSVGQRRYRVVGETFAGGGIDLLNLDTGEIMVVPERLAPDVLEARERGKSRLDAEVVAQIERVPGDSVFFTTVTRRAMTSFVGDMGVMGKFLPTPDGLLLSSACYADAGVFVRMPTKERLKMQFIVFVARKILANQAADAAASGSEDAALYDQMDISESPTGDALIFSLVLTRAQVVQIFMGG